MSRKANNNNTVNECMKNLEDTFDRATWSRNLMRIQCKNVKPDDDESTTAGNYKQRIVLVPVVY